MAEDEKIVHIAYTNGGICVLYPTHQPAFRGNFESEEAAIERIRWWNEKGDFQLKLEAERLDLRYDVNEERTKLGLGPL